MISSDYSWAQIVIGGTIGKKALNDGIFEACGYDLTSIGEQTSANPTMTMQDGHLVIEESQAVDGKFEELEEWLVANKVPFDRHNAASPGEWDNAVCFFRPGMEKPYEAVSDDNTTDPYVKVSDIRKRLELPSQGGIATLKELKRFLDEEHPEITELPPLELIDGGP